MAKDYFNRYVWLIDLIMRYGHISFQDISKHWERSSLNDKGEPLAERTFHNHRDAILQTFGIEINNDRTLGYYILNKEDLEGDGIRKWLFDSISMYNLLNRSTNLRNKILFERVPSSQPWLEVIVNAIAEGKAIEVSYQASWSDKPHTYCMHPYCLKLFKQRWYVIARRDEFDNPYVYALDERMKDIKIMNKKLEIPKDFDAKELYKDYYGVIMDFVEPEKVKIKVDADQVHYYESLPLHETQTIIEQNDEYTIFEYYLAPNYDFKHELLSKGESVEVIEPKWFRDDIKSTIKTMLNRYKK